MPKITELPAKTTGSAADLFAIVDNSGNVTKKLTIGGAATAIAANLPAGSVGITALAPNRFAHGSGIATANGAQVISGVTGFDFVPSFIKINAVFNQASASSNNASMSIGSYDASTNTQQSVNAFARNGQGSGDSNTTSAIVAVQTVNTGGASSLAGQAILSAVGNGTFTLTWSSIASPGVIYQWEAYA